MTNVLVCPVGSLLDAPLRGGDCRARDLNLERNVHGIHHFRETGHCHISNGLLRATVGDEGGLPALVLEGWRGSVAVGDYLSDTLSDILPGSMSTPEWIALGTVVINAPGTAPVLVAVRLEWLHPLGREVILRLLVPAVGDVFVSLARGERTLHVRHGDALGGVEAARSVRLTASPSPAGTAVGGRRIEEIAPGIEGFPRWVGTSEVSTLNAASFTVTTAAPVTTAAFGVGAGTSKRRDRPTDHHRQLSYDKRPVLVMR